MFAGLVSGTSNKALAFRHFRHFGNAYGVQIWGPSVDHHSRDGNTDGWKCMERPLVSMISRMIKAKASVPHEIIHAKLAAPPLVIEALTRSVSFMHSTWDLPRDRNARLALESSQQLATQGGHILLVCTDDNLLPIAWFRHGQTTPFPVLAGCTLLVSHTD